MIVTVLVEVYIGTVTFIVVDTVGVIVIVCPANPVPLALFDVTFGVVVGFSSDVVVPDVEVIVSVVTDALVEVVEDVMSGFEPLVEDVTGEGSSDWPARKGLPERCAKSIQSVVVKKFDNSN